MRPVLCSACDPQGWQCEREPHPPGTYHAIGLARGAEVELDEDGKPTVERAWLGTTLWRETNNRILDCLLDGAATPKEIAAVVKLSRNTVRKHLTILREEELAEPVGDGTWMA